MQFIPSSPEVALVVPPPRPSSDYTPDWYKSAKSGRSKPRFAPNGALKSITFKACMPFADALRGGFIQESWCDVHIESDENGQCSFWFRVGPQIVEIRDMTGPEATIPVNQKMFEASQFAWTCPWIPKTPRGWSILITSPMNRLDLPFRVTDGIIDSDRFHHAPMGFVPFYVEKGFSGTIPAGTPMFQMLPIKRQSRWTASPARFNHKQASKRSFIAMHRFTGLYSEKFWQRKLFETETATKGCPKSP